jgi:hypothetical protein
MAKLVHLHRLRKSVPLLISAATVWVIACASDSDKGAPIPNLEAGAFDGEGPGNPDGAISADGNAGDADAAPPPPSAGGTGAFGIVTVNGKQKLYLPLITLGAEGKAQIAVVDVGAPATGGDAGTPALLKTIDLDDSDNATASGGDANVVLAVSTTNRKIRFIDPKTDTLLKTIELPSSYGVSDFSGGGGFVTGVAVDSPHQRAIISVYDGFQIVDLSTMTLGAHIQAPPSENFGFDSVRGYVIAPFYDCDLAQDANAVALTFCDQYKNSDDAGSVLASGLNVIDLADNAVYTYVDPTADSLVEPLGGELDSASVDPTTGIVVVPAEGAASSNILDLSKALFDKGAKTFTAPVQNLTSLSYEGVSVEPTSHFAFWESEGTDEFAVADLTKIASGGPVIQAVMPLLPGDNTWQNMGDPHGIAVASGVLDGKPYGFLVNYDRTFVARIDLTGLLSAGSPGTELDGESTRPFVTYLDAKTSP